MITNVWKFKVKPGWEDRFLAMNTEDWPDLLSQSPHYCGTEVGRFQEDPEWYATVDYWDSREDFDEFMEIVSYEFQRLDKCHERTYESATHIGFFEVSV